MKAFIFSLFTLLYLQVSSQSLINQGNVNTKGLSETTLPIEIINDKIVLEVTIDGIESRFILDTGAPLLISTSLYDRLSVETLAILPNWDANGNVDTSRIVKTNKIKLGEFIFNGIPAVVLDIEKTPLRCDEIDGFIGSNLLRLLAIEFRLDSGQIVLSKSGQNVNYPSSIPVLLDAQSTPQFEVAIKDKIDTVIFDTGDNSFYTAKIDFVKSQLPDLNVLLKGFGTEGQGVFGSGVLGESFLLKEDLQVGSVSFDQTRFTTTPSHISRIGFKFLEVNQVLLDYPSKKLYFKRIDQEIDSFKTHGFSIYEVDGNIFIGNVWDSTPAHNAGIQSGDQIIKIDDLSLEGDFCDIQDKLRKVLEKQSIELIIKSKGSSDLKTFTINQVSL